MLGGARLGPETQVRELLLQFRAEPKSGLEHQDGGGRGGDTFGMEFREAEESRAGLGEGGYT